MADNNYFYIDIPNFFNRPGDSVITKEEMQNTFHCIINNDIRIAVKTPVFVIFANTFTITDWEEGWEDSVVGWKTTSTGSKTWYTKNDTINAGSYCYGFEVSLRQDGTKAYRFDDNTVFLNPSTTSVIDKPLNRNDEVPQESLINLPFEQFYDYNVYPNFTNPAYWWDSGDFKVNDHYLKFHAFDKFMINDTISNLDKQFTPKTWDRNNKGVIQYQHWNNKRPLFPQIIFDNMQDREEESPIEYELTTTTPNTKNEYVLRLKRQEFKIKPNDKIACYIRNPGSFESSKQQSISGYSYEKAGSTYTLTIAPNENIQVSNSLNFNPNSMRIYYILKNNIGSSGFKFSSQNIQQILQTTDVSTVSLFNHIVETTNAYLDLQPLLFPTVINETEKYNLNNVGIFQNTGTIKADLRNHSYYSNLEIRGIPYLRNNWTDNTIASNFNLIKVDCNWSIPDKEFGVIGTLDVNNGLITSLESNDMQLYQNQKTAEGCTLTIAYNKKKPVTSYGIAIVIFRDLNDWTEQELKQEFMKSLVEVYSMGNEHYYNNQGPFALYYVNNNQRTKVAPNQTQMINTERDVNHHWETETGFNLGKKI